MSLAILLVHAIESPGIAKGHEMRRSVGRRDFLSSVAAATISATAFSGSIPGEVAASVTDENKEYGLVIISPFDP